MGLLLQALLLAIVLGQVVFLATHWSARADLTQDGLYSFTASTQRLLDKLEQPLVIESYFSADDKLNAEWAQGRLNLESFLSELAKSAPGKIIQRRYDPQDEVEVADRAKRLGIRPVPMSDRGEGSVSVTEVWQGVRLLYAGERSRVFDVIVPRQARQIAYLEAEFTPAIQEVLTESKRKIGYMAWPIAPADIFRSGARRRDSVHDWRRIRALPALDRRYSFIDLKAANGVLAPEDLELLVLFRPRSLTDREKYVIDQFVLSGRPVVLFSDTHEYMLGPERRMVQRTFELDEDGSKVRWLDQLRGYGLDVGTEIVADYWDATMEDFYMLVPGRGGRVEPSRRQYPFWFHAWGVDWAQDSYVNLAATRRTDGSIDEELQTYYRQTYKPGINVEVPVLRDFFRQDSAPRGPGLFWPGPVRLVEPSPAGVTGRVWMRTSPFAVAKSPERILDPLGPSPNPVEQEKNFNRFRQALQGWFNVSAREQVPLAAEVTGSFVSAFRGQSIPKRPGQASDDDEDEEIEPDQPPGTEGEANTPSGEPMGPELPPTLEDPDNPATAPHLDESRAPGQLVVIGDADFLRDDLVDGTYQGMGGPISPLGTLFFVNLMDQLMQDTDLIELRTRSVRDRSLSFVDDDPGVSMSVSELAQARRRKEKAILWANILVPPLLLLGVGLLVLLRRAAQKRAFLGSLQDS